MVGCMIFLNGSSLKIPDSFFGRRQVEVEQISVSRWWQLWSRESGEDRFF